MSLEVPPPSVPPVVPLVPLVPKAPFEAATSGKRFGNYFIDAIMVNILQYAIAFAGIYGLVEINQFVASMVIYFGYYVGLESLNGKTIGKYVTGTRAVSIDGAELDFKQALLRSIIRFVPFEPFSFLGGARPSGWHDKWSKTMVVDDK